MDPIKSLLLAASAKGELESLQKVHAQLQTSSLKHSAHTHSQPDDLLLEDDDVLPINGHNETVTDPLDFCVTQDVLNKFTCYVFDRRFGWSEANSDGGGRVRRTSCTGAVLASSDGHHKAVINDMLDTFLIWFVKSHSGLYLKHFICNCGKILIKYNYYYFFNFTKRINFGR